jgi:peptide/nickel transport system permease protein
VKSEQGQSRTAATARIRERHGTALTDAVREQTSIGRRLRWSLSHHPLALIGLVLVSIMILTAIAAPLIAPMDPRTQSIGNRLLAPMERNRDGELHVLGTDNLGRDILSRVIYGSRISLAASFTAVLITAFVGLMLGLVSGYVGRWIDSVLMALVNLQLAFPFMLLALAIIALLGANLVNLVIVFVVTGWPIYARTIRAAVLGLKEREFVEAARAIGGSHSRIILRHLLPNVVSPLTVLASFMVAQLIILEAALGFLGLSVQPPTPTWGNMLADGRQYIQDAWWLSAFPGIAIMITAAGVNFIGDGLRDILDPTST